MLGLLPAALTTNRTNFTNIAWVGGDFLSAKYTKYAKVCLGCGAWVDRFFEPRKALKARNRVDG